MFLILFEKLKLTLSSISLKSYNLLFFLFEKLILAVSCSFFIKSKYFTCLVQYFCKDLMLLLFKKLIDDISAYFEKLILALSASFLKHNTCFVQYF